MTRYTGVENALLIVQDDVQLSGIASGGALVSQSGRLVASGIVSGPLTIESGGRAAVSGVISGPISVAEGSLLDVTGIVSGAVVQNDGEFYAAVGAVIHGRKLTASGKFAAPTLDAAVISDSTPRFLLRGTGIHLVVEGGF